MVMFIVMVMICFISILLMCYFYQKIGLQILFYLFYLLSFVFLLKNVKILNIDFNLMIVPYVGLLSITYIMNEKISIKEIHKKLKEFILFLIITVMLLIMLILYNPSVTDLITANLNKLIKNNYILLSLYPIFTFISLYGTCKVYNLIKRNSNVLFINISLTTILIGIFDCILFMVLSNICRYNVMYSLKLGLGNYLVKIILSLIFIPVVSYVINKKRLV